MVARSGTPCTPATGQWRSTWTKQRLCSEDVDTAYNQRNARRINPVFESVKHKQLVDATANFICQGLQPLSVVDEPAFRRLLEIAEPRFNLPHRTYFTDIVITTKYCATRAIIENQLVAVENCAVTTDLWPSLHQQHAYILVTACFVDSDSIIKAITVPFLTIIVILSW